VIGTLAPAGWTSKTRCNCSSAARRSRGDSERPVVLSQSEIADSDSRKPWTSLPPSPPPPLEQFLNAVGGAKNEPLVKPGEAAARVAVMQAIYEGAREHKW